MANTNLTIDQITRETLQVLHEKLVFIGSIVREYDDSYAQTGAKIGDALRIRLPDEYVVQDGATLVNQDAVESQVSLTVSNQKHVGLRFTSKELALDIDDFRERKLVPAMSVLAARMESDALTMRNDVSAITDNDGNAITFRNITDTRAGLNKALAPKDNQRFLLLTDDHSAVIVDTLKGLFHQSTEIGQQYREGMMGRSAGFNFLESSLATDHTTGTAAKTTGYLTNDATAQTGNTLTVDTGTATFLVGDIITIAGVNAVHPETKEDLGFLKSFVVTANSGASATSLSISPAINDGSGADAGRQNVTVAAPNNAAIVKVGAGNGELYSGSIAYHRNAFAFATADLEMPDGTHMAAREVFDGLSMRIVKDYDINNDRFPCRADVLYGYQTLREQLARRLHADG